MFVHHTIHLNRTQVRTEMSFLAAKCLNLIIISIQTIVFNTTLFAF